MCAVDFIKQHLMLECQKLVVFVYHSEVQKYLKEFLQKININVISVEGKFASQQRIKLIE